MTPAEQVKAMQDRGEVCACAGCASYVERAIAAAILAEREECARVADADANAWSESDTYCADACAEIAAAIRARGQR